MCGVRLLYAETGSGSLTPAVIKLYHHCPFLGSIKIHSSSVLVTLNGTTGDMTYINHSINDIQYYIAINMIQVKLLAILTQY